MYVWVVMKEWMFGGESYADISRIYKDEKSAEAYVEAQETHHQGYRNTYDVVKWEVE